MLTLAELKDLLKINNIDFKEAAISLGYTTLGINNNWSKDEPIPLKAQNLFSNYIRLKQLEKENIELKKQLIEYKEDKKLTNYLSKKSLQIAQQKCSQNKIDIEDYLSSLVMANI